jgi:hydrogenase maturation factor
MKRGIRATVIGEVIKDKEKRILIDEEGEKTLPRQEKDEIWKLY